MERVSSTHPYNRARLSVSDCKLLDMARPKEGKESLIVRIDPELRSRLVRVVVSLGYTYTRDGIDQPAWGRFLEAIASGEIIAYKKISRPP